MSHRQIAVAVLALTVALDMLLGLIHALVTPGLPVWHGLFCAEANMVTDGCDLPPARAGYLITALEYTLVVPLGAASISLFISGLTSMHIGRSEHRIKQHLEDRLRHHLDGDANDQAG